MTMVFQGLDASGQIIERTGASGIDGNRQFVGIFIKPCRYQFRKQNRRQVVDAKIACILKRIEGD